MNDFNYKDYDYLIIVTYEKYTDSFATKGDLDEAWKNIKFRKGLRVISVFIEDTIE